MKQLFLSVRYRVASAPFWIGVLLCAAAYTMGPLNEYEIDDILYYYTYSTTFGVFYPLASCIAMLPNFMTLSRAMHGSLYNQIVSRSSLKRYLLGVAAPCSLIGGLTLVAGPVLVTLFQLPSLSFVTDAFLELYSTDGGELNVSLSAFVEGRQWGLFFSMKLLLLLFHGCSAVMIAFAVAPHSRDSFVILFAPFLAVRLSDMFHWGSIVKFSTLFTGFYLDVPFDNAWGFMGYAAIAQILLWLLCFFCAYWGMKARWNRA